MLLYKKGNLFDEDVDVLVNPVNCVGIMGKGLALQFKKYYLDNFKAYVVACKKGLIKPGKLFIFNNDLLNPRYIFNFPTKRHWKDRSILGDIELGLICMAKELLRLNVHSMAIPPLGCGLGGLPWENVQQLIEDILCTLVEVKILVFEPLNKV